ncbi:hypothetical protein ASPBRDRAFT_364443 [Aspergillus brasiliensis CBS 101740]|uniref:Uncharacterized protein n=1 Tax=Aspergillus brasiliensis (strain CBS 101740 / IMI 381727 / IBT 21946) TaxID=767769 RepID=A0A1L9U569_ASPBC|nr:hypothetical protein ASPBRDRAFT_364443 [Aspergillus brasiliensis CBS 101740]
MWYKREIAAHHESRYPYLRPKADSTNWNPRPRKSPSDSITRLRKEIPIFWPPDGVEMQCHKIHTYHRERVIDSIIFFIGNLALDTQCWQGAKRSCAASGHTVRSQCFDRGSFFLSGWRLTFKPVPTDQVPAAVVQIVKGLCSIPPARLTTITGWLGVPTRSYIMIRTHKCA